MILRSVSTYVLCPSRNLALEQCLCSVTTNLHRLVLHPHLRPHHFHRRHQRQQYHLLTLVLAIVPHCVVLPPLDRGRSACSVGKCVCSPCTCAHRSVCSRRRWLARSSPREGRNSRCRRLAADEPEASGSLLIESHRSRHSF